MARIIRRSGKIEEKGESVSEFKARQRLKRFKRRGITSSEVKKIKSKGSTIQKLVTSLQKKASTGKEIVQPKGTTIVQKKSGAVFQRIIRTAKGIRVIETPISSFRKIKTITTIVKPKRSKSRKVKKLAQDFGRMTVSGQVLQTLPRSEEAIKKEIKRLEPGLIIPEKMPRISLVPKVERDVVKASQISATIIKELETQAKNINDINLAKRIIRLKQQGKFTPNIKNEIKKNIKRKQKQQTEAIRKIDFIFNKLDKRNKKFDDSVSRFFGFLSIDTRTGKKVKLNKLDRILKRTSLKALRFANPLIVGDQIGGSLEALRTAKEAGLINPKQLIKSGVKISSIGAKAISKEIATLDFKKLNERSKKASKLIVKGIKITKKSLKTEAGLSTFLAIALLSGIPQRAIKSGIKIIVKGSGKTAKKTIQITPKLLKEFNKTTKSLIRSKKAQARVFRKSARRLTKGELRKGAGRKTFTKSQLKGIKQTKKQTIQQQRSTFVKQFTKKESLKIPTGKLKTVPVSKKTILIKKGRTVVGKISKAVKKPKLTKAKKVTVKKDFDVFVQTEDKTGQILLVAKKKKLPKSKVQKLVQKVKQKKKQLGLRVKQPTSKEILRKGKVNYVDSPAPKTFELGLKRGGGRDAVKKRLIARIMAKQKELKKVSVIKKRIIKSKKIIKKVKGKVKTKKELSLKRRQEFVRKKELKVKPRKKIDPVFTDRRATGQEVLVLPETIQTFNKDLTTYFNNAFYLQNELPTGASAGFFRNIAKKSKLTIEQKVNLAIKSAGKQMKVYKTGLKVSTIDKVKFSKAMRNKIKESLRIASLIKPSLKIDKKQDKKLRRSLSIVSTTKPKIKISVKVIQVKGKDIKPKPKLKLPSIKTKPRISIKTKPIISIKPKPIISIKPKPKPLIKTKPKPQKPREPITKKPRIKIPILFFKKTKKKQFIKISKKKKEIKIFTPTLLRPKKRKKRLLFTPINEIFVGLKKR